MFPNLPYPGYTWQITQHTGIVCADTIIGLLRGCAELDGKPIDIAAIDARLNELGRFSSETGRSLWRDYQQVLSEFGFIVSSASNNGMLLLTPVAKELLAGSLSFDEAMTLQLMRYQYANGFKRTIPNNVTLEDGGDLSSFATLTSLQETYGVCIRPFAFTWEVLDRLSKKIQKQANLSIDEMAKFVLRCSNHSEVEACCNAIISSRNGEDEIPEQGGNIRRNAADWMKLLSMTSVFSLNTTGRQNSITLSEQACVHEESLRWLIQQFNIEDSFWKENSGEDWFSFYGRIDTRLINVFSNPQYRLGWLMPSFIGGIKMSQSQISQTIKHSHLPLQLITFGAPGTGKSYLLREKASVFDRKCQERVTFYPTYTYQQFVGTYKPAMKKRCTSVSAEAREVLAVLQDKEKTVQEKYDALYDSFNRRNQLTRLPLLLGICGFDGELKTRKADGTNASNDNIVELNHGKALREYVRLITTEGEHQISYEYVPGPFLRLLAKAYQNPDKDYLLIIEELNRANAAAVFGDAFQLLDRKADGTSEYPIAMSEDMKQYFQEMKLELDELFLPANFYIWATMNSADQGVFPIDTAFKRRWDFEYLGIDTNEEMISAYKYSFKDGKYYWNTIRKTINAKLLAMRINEDKLLGPFFVGLDVLEADDRVFIEAFKSMVLMYLFEDAIRHNPSALFNGKDGLFSYSIICRQLEEGGLKAVFNFDIEQAKDLDEPDDKGGQGNA